MQRARAKIFSMKYVLMDVYQVCANKSPWVKIGPATFGWGGLYTGERPQGHHGALVKISFFIWFLLNIEMD
jgi:hypothetical protein